MAIYEDSYEEAVKFIRKSWEERGSKPKLFAKVKTNFGEKFMIDYSEDKIQPELVVVENLKSCVNKIIKVNDERKWWQFWKT
jgi:hypothetical protein